MSHWAYTNHEEPHQDNPVLHNSNWGGIRMGSSWQVFWGYRGISGRSTLNNSCSIWPCGSNGNSFQMVFLSGALYFGKCLLFVSCKLYNVCSLHCTVERYTHVIIIAPRSYTFAYYLYFYPFLLLKLCEGGGVSTAMYCWYLGISGSLETCFGGTIGLKSSKCNGLKWVFQGSSGCKKP